MASTAGDTELKRASSPSGGDGEARRFSSVPLASEVLGGFGTWRTRWRRRREVQSRTRGHGGRRNRSGPRKGGVRGRGRLRVSRNLSGRRSWDVGTRERGRREGEVDAEVLGSSQVDDDAEGRVLLCISPYPDGRDGEVEEPPSPRSRSIQSRSKTLDPQGLFFYS